VPLLQQHEQLVLLPRGARRVGARHARLGRREPATFELVEYVARAPRLAAVTLVAVCAAVRVAAARHQRRCRFRRAAVAVTARAAAVVRRVARAALGTAKVTAGRPVQATALGRRGRSSTAAVAAFL